MYVCMSQSMYTCTLPVHDICTGTHVNVHMYVYCTLVMYRVPTVLHFLKLSLVNFFETFLTHHTYLSETNGRQDPTN